MEGGRIILYACIDVFDIHSLPLWPTHAASVDLYHIIKAYGHKNQYQLI